MKQFLGGSLLFLVVSSTALAQSSATLPTNTSETTITTTPSFLANPSLIAGWRSYTDSGRPEQITSPNQKDFKSKNEFYVGAKSQAGFGFQAMAVETAESYNSALPGTKSPKISGTSPRDPSLSLLHPIYSTERLNMNGVFREYFPVSDRSQTLGIYQQAYYFNVLYKARGGVDYFNQLVPRYFSQARYSPGGKDSVFYTEDYTEVAEWTNGWFKWGMGQHYQLETHNDYPVGQTLEVYPFAYFILSKTIFLSPRVYFPVAVQNYVYDAPTAVSFNNIQAELFFQATL